MDTNLLLQIVIGAILAGLAAISTYLHSRLTTLENTVNDNHASLLSEIAKSNAKPRRFGYYPEDEAQ